jgi:hypothetical protein
MLEPDYTRWAIWAAGVRCGRPQAAVLAPASGPNPLRSDGYRVRPRDRRLTR